MRIRIASIGFTLIASIVLLGPSTLFALSPIMCADGQTAPNHADGRCPDTEVQRLVDHLQAQIQQLLAQIAALKGETTVTPTKCIDLSFNFGPDDTDADTKGDVSKLQGFLVSQGFLRAELPRGYFGFATMKALQSWQSSRGIASSGDPDSTGWGFVGPKTRRVMACVKQEPRVECPIYNAPLCNAGEELTSYVNERGCSVPRCTPITSGKCGVNSFSIGNACPVALGSSSLVYSSARIQCYDGYAETITNSCQTASDLQEMARRICEKRCSSANKPPVISSFSGPTSLRANEQGTWKIQASDPENGTLSYHVQWGDEGFSGNHAALAMGGQVSFTQETTFTHSYTYPNDNDLPFTITIYVRDSAGQTARASATVKIANSPTVCTTEYAPVCGLRPWTCSAPAGAACNAPPREELMTTYGNRCEMGRAGATYLYDGACKTALTCRGYDYNLKDALREFGEGESTSCIPAVGAERQCIADAKYVCRSGEWKTEGGLPSASNAQFTASALSALEAALKRLQALLGR